MLTNKINNKCYIGQSVNTLEKRWTQHKSNAKKQAQKCRFLENAILKYGHENFKQEVLLYCNQADLNSYETNMINIYMTGDRTFGYNICDGGGGSISRPVLEDHRNKISIANKKTDLPINIQERRDSDGILTGYVVAKHDNNIRYNKNFGNTSNTLDENLQLATQWLNDLNLGKIDEIANKYNRTLDLPTNISYNYNKKKVIVGFTVKIERKGIRNCKSFTFKNLSMDEKLKMAIEYKAKYLEELSKNEQKTL